MGIPVGLPVADHNCEHRDLLHRHTHDPHHWFELGLAEAHRLQSEVLTPHVTTHPVTLYSGLEVPLSELVFDRPMGLAYFTSSYDRRIAKQYATAFGVLLILHLPIGVHAVCLKNVSRHPHEGEVLLHGNGVLTELPRWPSVVQMQHARKEITVVECRHQHTSG